MPKLSLCCICGNEEPYILRFLESFSGSFDELCLVRAVGNQPHDKTLTMAKEWCAGHGKSIKLGEYFNEGWKPADLSPGAEVIESIPATWPHVDDFSAARNMAWDLATGDWQLWADLDDILVVGSAERIRAHSLDEKYDVFFFRYSIPSQNEANCRERMYRRGLARWAAPVHETCQLQNHLFPGRRFAAFTDEEVVYSHEPDAKLKQPSRRNLRIVTHALRFLNAFAYDMHRESFYQWAAHKKPEDRENAVKWAEIARHADTHGELKAQIFINLTVLFEDSDMEQALELAYLAVRIMPLRRESWGRVAELQLKAGCPNKAREATSIMRSLPKPGPSGLPRTERYYGWEGLTLRLRAVRATGDEALARKEENEVFQKHGARFSLLHATRGRPEQAIATRANFFMAALHPLGIEHIFAIDEDDKESIEKLKTFRHVIVKEPRGCVKAWNAAAAESSGAVLVQLSDDWLPCMHWDELCWLALRQEAVIKPGEFAIERNERVRDCALVLAISDGHRTDDLLCMAICTRARYEQQVYTSPWDNTPTLFHPDYFGVFSDNEFSVRAYDDDVVVKAKHICFDHRHPIFAGKKWEEMDATYQRQNAAERYREGLEIFNRRNPTHAIK